MKTNPGQEDRVGKYCKTIPGQRTVKTQVNPGQQGQGTNNDQIIQFLTKNFKFLRTSYNVATKETSSIGRHGERAKTRVSSKAQPQSTTRKTSFPGRKYQVIRIHTKIPETQRHDAKGTTKETSHTGCNSRTSSKNQLNQQER